MEALTMTLKQFQRGANAVGYAVIASPCERVKGTPAVLPPFDDGTVVDQPFHWDREASYDELCAYTSAAFQENTKKQTEQEWKTEWLAHSATWIPYIIRTD
jgi:hypothetical protein